jgi:hypothetical protein
MEDARREELIKRFPKTYAIYQQIIDKTSTFQPCPLWNYMKNECDFGMSHWCGADGFERFIKEAGVHIDEVKQ